MKSSKNRENWNKNYKIKKKGENLNIFLINKVRIAKLCRNVMQNYAKIERTPRKGKIP